MMLKIEGMEKYLSAGHISFGMLSPEEQSAIKDNFSTRDRLEAEYGKPDEDEELMNWICDQAEKEVSGSAEALVKWFDLQDQLFHAGNG
ncbi:MAG: hypothetical protein V1858_02285 [Candidatus Gottesmanbacteria bacterium]